MKDSSYVYMRYILWEWKNIIYIIEFGFFGQIGPLMLIITLMHFPICWKLLIIYFTTNNLSHYLINAVLVKMWNKDNNQPVTNNRLNKSYLVGTSETTREVLNNNISFYHINHHNNSYTPLIREDLDDKKFNQWLAGLIDGDGYFGISQGKYLSCEITIELRDEKTLKQIQNKFGGSVKLRAGIKAIRYRLHNKESMIKLVNAVNGNIRNTKRLVQFNKVCNLLDIPFINPITLTKYNAWFSGFFDADGTITYSFKNNSPQLLISVTNKYLQDIEHYNIFNIGNINFDKSKNGYFKWSIQSEKDIINYIKNYNKLFPSRTIKQKRLLLVNEYFNLKVLKAYNQPANTLLYKAWLNFENKWKY